MPEFEVFVDRHRAPPGQAEIGIQTRGVFALNLASYRALREPESVELLFAPTEDLIGLRAISPEERHAYPVRARHGTTYLVSCKAFMDRYAIDYSAPRRLPARMRDGILVADLKAAGGDNASDLG